MRLIELHPVLEVALRRQGQGPALHAVRTLTAGLAGGMVIAVIAQAGTVAPRRLQELGAEMFLTSGLISAVAVLLLVPATAVGPFVRARESGMLDALVLTGCPEAQIVRAFWWSSMVGTAQTLAGILPFLILAASVGGVMLPDVLGLMAGALVCAGVLTALALTLGVSHGSAASSGQALMAFAVAGGGVAVAVPFFLRVVLPTFGSIPYWVQSRELSSLMVGCLLLVGMVLLLSDAGRRLQREAREASPETMYSLAVAASPLALRVSIVDPVGHRMARHLPWPRMIASGATVATLLLAIPLLSPWGVRLAHVALALALLSMVLGAWLGSRLSDAVLGGDLARGLALSSHDPARIKRQLLRAAAGTCAWPLLVGSTLFLAGAASGQLEVRAALLASMLAPAGWLLCVSLAMRLVATGRRAAVSPVLATVIVVSSLLGGAMWVGALSEAGSLWRLAHPVTLLALLSGLGLQYWKWAGPVALATLGWCLVALHTNEMMSEAMRRRFREPDAR